MATPARGHLPAPVRGFHTAAHNNEKATIMYTTGCIWVWTARIALGIVWVGSKESKIPAAPTVTATMYAYFFDTRLGKRIIESA